MHVLWSEKNVLVVYTSRWSWKNVNWVFRNSSAALCPHHLIRDHAGNLLHVFSNARSLSHSKSIVQSTNIWKGYTLAVPVADSSWLVSVSKLHGENSHIVAFWMNLKMVHVTNTNIQVVSVLSTK